MKKPQYAANQGRLFVLAGIIGETEHYEPVAHKQVLYKGKRWSASILAHYLEHGELVKRVPRKRKQYRASVRDGGKIVSLGYFMTQEERDAAILNYKLFGLLPEK